MRLLLFHAREPYQLLVHALASLAVVMATLGRGVSRLNLRQKLSCLFEWPTPRAPDFSTITNQNIICISNYLFKIIATLDILV